MLEDNLDTSNEGILPSNDVQKSVDVSKPHTRTKSRMEDQENTRNHSSVFMVFLFIVLCLFAFSLLRGGSYSSIAHGNNGGIVHNFFEDHTIHVGNSKGTLLDENKFREIVQKQYESVNSRINEIIQHEIATVHTSLSSSVNEKLLDMNHQIKELSAQPKPVSRSVGKCQGMSINHMVV